MKKTVAPLIVITKIFFDLNSLKKDADVGIVPNFMGRSRLNTTS